MDANDTMLNMCLQRNIELEDALKEMVASYAYLPADQDHAVHQAYSRACSVLEGITPEEKFRRMFPK